MIAETNIPVNLPQESFKAYLLKSRRNKVILWITAAAIIIQFAVFKYFYPYASYIHGDSFVYLDIAHRNLDISSYMVGYARFLRIFSVFARSDIALVAFQYLLIQSSMLFLLSTVCYFYRPGKIMTAILLSFMVLNPLFLHMANMVSSDGFFLALSLTWFALLLWILHRPAARHLIWHTIIISIAFTVRYNALIYPGIAAGVFLLSQQSVRRKIIGLGLPVLLCGTFVLYTGNKYKQLTGAWQYSPFGGWLMANNAMYAYRYVDSAHRKPVPDKYKALDNMIRTYFDSTRDVKKHPQELLEASTVYMWTPDLSLYKYRDALFKKDSGASDFKMWASMGPFYKAYGTYIIKQYPLAYARHFLWPNAMKYYAPPVEFLENYNSGYDYVPPAAQQWFGYKSAQVSTRTKDLKVRILAFYPILSGIINAVMLFGLICFVMLNGLRLNMLFRKGMILAGTIWLLNAGFTIFASSAALRFQAFPVMLTTIFVLLLVDWLWKMGINEAKQGQQPEQDSETSGRPLEGTLTAEKIDPSPIRI